MWKPSRLTSAIARPTGLSESLEETFHLQWRKMKGIRPLESGRRRVESKETAHFIPDRISRKESRTERKEVIAILKIVISSPFRN
jgi:hypothetical protein